MANHLELKEALCMHENLCNQVPSKKSQTSITFSKSSSDETACGCCCESCYRRSCNCYCAKRKNNLLIKSKKKEVRICLSSN